MVIQFMYHHAGLGDLRCILASKLHGELEASRLLRHQGYPRGLYGRLVAGGFAGLLLANPLPPRYRDPRSGVDE
jgi:hypothetical protein